MANINWDNELRLAAMDADVGAAEVLLPNIVRTTPNVESSVIDFMGAKLAIQ